MKKKWIIMLTVLLLLTGCSKKATVHVSNENGFKSNTRIKNNSYEIFEENGWKQVNLKSIDLVNSIPGKNKKDINKDDYYELIEKAHEANANMIKINDLFPPEFYSALLDYNKSQENPIYLLQGIPMDTSNFKENPDPFKLDNMVPFEVKISTVIDAVHGKVTIPEIKDKKGQITGTFSSDVSPYIGGYILGTKWDPNIIDYTNNNRTDKKDYTGDYIVTENANPFEIFIAGALNHAIDYEMENYNWMNPVSFLNFPGTDILDHPYEPDPLEDFVSINPNLIKGKTDNISYFVSYDIYPYYPDFLNLDPKYTKYIDHRGNTNNYAGYLNDLISKHETPVFISQFGIPASRGLSRISTSNMNKGQHSETDQGHILSNMYDDIIHQGALGGSIASLQDNLRGISWNMKNLDSVKHRTRWSNVQNSKQHFGLISYENNRIQVDGSDKDWKKLKAEPIYKTEKDDDNIIDSVYVENDDRYLYMGVKFKEIDFENFNTLIFLDTLPNQGNYSNPFNPKIKTEDPAEFVINISNKKDSKIVVDSYYDIFYYKNSIENEYLEVNEDFKVKHNEIYNPIKSIINEPITNEKTGFKVPFVDFETGRLVKGNGNPDSEDYNSLTDYAINEKENFLEVRIPWALINFTDPSNKEVLGDFQSKGIKERTKVEGLILSVATYDKNNKDTIYSLPSNTKGKIGPARMYSWHNWDSLDLTPRLKESYFIIQDLYKEY